MSGRPLSYVEGQDARLDALAARYKELEGRPAVLGRDDDGEGRPTSDPFGFGERRGPPTSDPWARGKVAADKLLNCLNLLIAEQGLSPDEAMFAQELASLNVLNAPDTPLTPERKVAARKAAYDYYMANRPR